MAWNLDTSLSEDPDGAEKDSRSALSKGRDWLLQNDTPMSKATLGTPRTQPNTPSPGNKIDLLAVARAQYREEKEEKARAKAAAPQAEHSEHITRICADALEFTPGVDTGFMNSDEKKPNKSLGVRQDPRLARLSHRLASNASEHSHATLVEGSPLGEKKAELKIEQTIEVIDLAEHNTEQLRFPCDGRSFTTGYSWSQSGLMLSQSGSQAWHRPDSPLFSNLPHQISAPNVDYGELCEQWRHRVPGFTGEITLKKRHPEIDQCCFDVVTGNLDEAVKQPQTYQNPSVDPKLAFNCHNMTSALLIERKVSMDSRMKADQELRARAPVQEEVNIEPTSLPSAECIIRPASLEDIDAIAKIAREALNSASEAPEPNERAILEDIQSVLRKSHSQRLPAIVALSTEEDLMNRSNWPDGAEATYQAFLKFMGSQPQPRSQVLGFAFVEEVPMSFLAVPGSASSHVVEARIMVKEDSRQKNIGSALLDRLLQVTCPYHSGAINHKWECDEPANTYEYPISKNQRQFTQLLVRVVHASKEGGPADWQGRFLERFGFSKFGVLKEALRIHHDFHDEWLDVTTFQRELQAAQHIPRKALSD